MTDATEGTRATDQGQPSLAARLKAAQAEQHALPPPMRVTVADFDMPFGSMIVFILKWALAAIPAVLILVVVAGMASAVLAGTVAGLSLLTPSRPAVSRREAAHDLASQLRTAKTAAVSNALLIDLIKKSGHPCDDVREAAPDSYGWWMTTCADGHKYAVIPGEAGAQVNPR